MANILKEKLTFCRRIKRNGIYTGNINGNVIRLVDRAVISPIDPNEIKFLLEDPEIEILASNQKEQKEENARKGEQDKNLPKIQPPVKK